MICVRVCWSVEFPNFVFTCNRTINMLSWRCGVVADDPVSTITAIIMACSGCLSTANALTAAAAATATSVHKTINVPAFVWVDSNMLLSTREMCAYVYTRLYAVQLSGPYVSHADHRNHKCAPFTFAHRYIAHECDAHTHNGVSSIWIGACRKPPRLLTDSRSPD